MFRFNFIRKLIRRYMKPIHEERAIVIERRLSIIYFIICWNAFGLVTYMFFKGKADWAAHYGYKSEEEMAMPPAQSWARTLNIPNAKVIRVSGMSVSQKYEIKDGDIVQPGQNTADQQ